MGPPQTSPGNELGWVAGRSAYGMPICG